MIIKINLSSKLTNNLQNCNIKAVDIISHILSTNTDIKTDIQDISNTALKDLYIIDNNNNNKLYCHAVKIDTLENVYILSFKED